jgi:prevent-host-death family protein
MRPLTNMPHHEPKLEGRPAERYPERAIKERRKALADLMKQRQRPLLDDLLDLTSCVAFAERLLANASVRRYLRKNHTTTLSQMKELIAMIRQSGGDCEEVTMTVWSIARAKNELAELVKQAKTNGPQLIRTKHYPVVVVVSIRRWNAMLRRHPELEKFFWQKTIRSPSKARRDTGRS